MCRCLVPERDPCLIENIDRGSVFARACFADLYLVMDGEWNSDIQ